MVLSLQYVCGENFRVILCLCISVFSPSFVVFGLFLLMYVDFLSVFVFVCSCTIFVFI